ncbi:ABC transporter ATP-binding protein [Parasphingorhabdus pacifica]
MGWRSIGSPSSTGTPPHSATWPSPSPRARCSDSWEATARGKTTTMRIVLGVLAGDSGEVRWDGSPLTAQLRRRIGYMPEERGLYPRMKLLEQLTYLGELHGLTRKHARTSAEQWIDRLGLAARRNDEVQKLSLGNQQRAQLAAALVHEPELLVLDEPFSGLDPVAVDTISEVLTEQCSAGVPVVFSSHQLELVERLCQRVGIVQQGQMVSCGTVEELRDRGPTTLVVEAPEARRGWADDLRGVRVVEAADQRTTLELTDGADDQTVLRAALATGPVREFNRYRPTLSDLYRNVVTEERGT